MCAACVHAVARVGAVDWLAQRAPYSAVQPYVFVTAPGGDLSEAIFGGVLSTFSTSGAGTRLFQFAQGTSMATPHVTGVIALMQAAALSVPSTGRALTPLEVESILAATAGDRGPVGRDPEYGHGLVDAHAAVALAMTLVGGAPTPVVPVPYPFPPLAIFTADVPASTLDSVVFNLSGGTLSLATATPTVFEPPSGTWLTAALLSDPRCTTAGTQNCVVRIGANRSGLAPGVYSGMVEVTSNVEPFGILALLRVGLGGLADLGTVTVRLIGVDPATERLVVRATTTTSAAQGYRYTFAAVPPGNYGVDAGIDLDGSGFFGDAPGEVSGLYPFPGTPAVVTVTAGQTTTGIDFPVSDVQAIVEF